MITEIDGNLALVGKDDSYLPYIYYTIHCSDLSDSKVKMHSVFQLQFNKTYELIAKINEFNKAKLLSIDSKTKKQFLQVWLKEVDMKGGFYLHKQYLNRGLPKKEEKFISVSNDFFFGVKTAVACMRDDILYG